jgi:hypothetical protein
MVYHLSKKETPQNVTQSSILKLEDLINIDIIKQQTPTTYQDDYHDYGGIHTITQYILYTAMVKIKFNLTFRCYHLTCGKQGYA